MSFRGACEFCSRNDFLLSSSCSVGCTLPVVSVTRETIVWSPGVAPFQVYVNSFHPYFSFVDGSIVAACHGPSSTFTSTDLIAVPSFSTTPVTLCALPFLVTRATNDFNCMCVTAVSFNRISPSIISLRTVRYQRAWYLPRYCSS